VVLTEYLVPLEGHVVTRHDEEAAKKERGRRLQSAAWRKWKPDIYYVMKSSASGRKELEPHECVAPLPPLRSALPGQEDERGERVRLLFKATGSFGYARKEAGIKMDSGMLGARETWQYQRCWAAAHVPNDDFDEWWLDLDFGVTRTITSISISGRAPRVELFPKPDYSIAPKLRQAEPRFPVVDPTGDGFVRKFQLSVRERREWRHLGIFVGNDHSLSVVDINLPKDLRGRFLRIQPLSQRAKGFGGNAPGMRVAVWGLRSELDCEKSHEDANQELVRYRIIEKQGPTRTRVTERDSVGSDAMSSWSCRSARRRALMETSMA